MPTALITGGNTGLGAAFARRLAADGHQLVLVARNEERLDALAAELSLRHGVGVEVLVADLTDPHQRSAVERRLQASSPSAVDVLVNNAGSNARSSIERTDPAAMQAEIDVNIAATLHLSRAVVPGMLARGRGTIVNVSSFAGYLSEPGSSYAASKAWILAFTDTLAASLVGSGVRAIAVCAGRMRTGRHVGLDRSRTAWLIWLNPDEVVDRCLADLRKNRTLSVPGAVYGTVVSLLEAPRRSLRLAARVAGRGR